MAHRTLNPEKAFYGDGRETSDYDKRNGWTGKHKLRGAKAIWPSVFPGRPLPFYLGCMQDVYYELKQAGYVFDTRMKIWRKKNAPNTASTGQVTPVPSSQAETSKSLAPSK